MTDEERLNLAKRPRYDVGDELQLVTAGMLQHLNGARCTVTYVQPMQTMLGHVAGYFYDVQLRNHARLKLVSEDMLAPIVEPKP